MQSVTPATRATWATVFATGWVAILAATYVTFAMEINEAAALYLLSPLILFWRHQRQVLPRWAFRLVRFGILNVAVGVLVSNLISFGGFDRYTIDAFFGSSYGRGFDSSTLPAWLICAFAWLSALDEKGWTYRMMSSEWGSR